LERVRFDELLFWTTPVTLVPMTALITLVAALLGIGDGVAVVTVCPKG